MASIAAILRVFIPPWVMAIAALTEAPAAVTCVPMQAEIKIISLLDS